MTKTHRLDLLNNSISYFREAVSYAHRDSTETNQWKFAILHVVQAMELALKERLRRIHPAFIYESIDKLDKTVSARGAIARLGNPKIGNIQISEGDRSKIEKAFDLRNQLTHFEFDHSHEHIELKFAEIFSFLIFFYRSQLGLETEAFIDEDQHGKIIGLVNARKELLQRAQNHVAGLKNADIWLCPECSEATFVVVDEQCCFCHRKEKIIDCPTCGMAGFEHDLIDISDAFDWSVDEGRVTIDDFGMETVCCSECVQDTREKIDDVRRSQYDEDMAMEEYYYQKGK